MKRVERMNQKGISIVLIVGLIVVFGVVGFVGWKVLGNNKADSNISEQAQTAEQNTENLPADQQVDKAVEEVDSVNIDDSELNEIESQLDY
jgi:hypothetical protein